MKITRKQLKQIIKEEFQHINEASDQDVQTFITGFSTMINSVDDLFKQGFSGELGKLTINFPDENFDNTGGNNKEDILIRVNKIKSTAYDGNLFAAKVDVLGDLAGGLHMGSLKK